MAYTAPPTVTDVVATAANGNTYIRDNQRALKDPPSANYESNEIADYSISSATYANVDISDFTLSLTTTGGDIYIGFTGSFAVSGGGVGYIDVSVDGTRIINQSVGGLIAINTSTARVASFVHIIQGLSAGSHTFILQWKRELAGTLTLYAGAGTASLDVHPQFWVRELT